ncbi:MAG: PAS domain-containing sensor histidine kinase [Phyllobacterium sp.]
MNSHSNQLSGLADICRSYCDRWVSDRVTDAVERANDARLVGAFIAMPFVLAAVLMLSVDAMAEATGMISLFVALLALPMVLCASVSLSASSRLASLAGLAVYGGGIALSGIVAPPAGLALWVLALAIPLEAWLVRRSAASFCAGAGMAAVTLAALGLSSLLTGAAPVLTIGSAILTIIYLAALAVRGLMLAGTRRIERIQIDEAADIANAIDGVILHMSHEGVITDASAKIATHFGVARQMLIGTAFIDRVHVADRIHFLGQLADVRGGIARNGLELRIRCVNAGEEALSDNSDRSARYHAVEYRTFRLDATPRASGLGMIVIARDVSEETAAREALEQALHAAEANHVSKGRFLAAVSHELRTPLNSVIGFSDSLLQGVFGGFSDTRQHEYVELIHKSGAHLLSVVNTILDASKIETGSYPLHVESFDFADAVKLVHAMLDQQAQQKGISLCNRVKVNAGEVKADRRAIQQILINLVGNAVKFTGNGGMVAIDAAVDMQDMVFTVSDTGIGIDEENVAWLGKPFMRIQNDYTRDCEGTGLGLAMVKGLVELHQGTVTIVSRVGEGTAVTVRIPLAGAQPHGETAGSGAVIDLKTDGRSEGDFYVEKRKTA